MSKSRTALESYHKQHPLRTGLPKEELRSRLGLGGQIFAKVIEKLVEDGALVEEGSAVRLPEHSRVLSAKQQAEVDRYLAALDAQPFLRLQTRESVGSLLPAWWMEAGWSG